MAGHAGLPCTPSASSRHRAEDRYWCWRSGSRRPHGEFKSNGRALRFNVNSCVYLDFVHTVHKTEA